MRFGPAALLVLLAGCLPDQAAPPDRTAAAVPSATEQIEVRSFEVTPRTVRPGGTATVTIDFETAAPTQAVTLDWHGPDGWLAAFEPVDTSRTHVTAQAPVESFEHPGRYRAVIRSGARNLAETSLIVAE